MKHKNNVKFGICLNCMYHETEVNFLNSFLRCLSFELQNVLQTSLGLPP